MGHQSLASKFPRLYLNSLHMEDNIASLSGWEDGLWKWKLQ